ncbi:hypothetical protein P167DRAFT_494079 [Morchella conica CCBAS932]|uniref:CENP-V/GFA domain-containing protein n=2 Tax=Morchella sect. Distantes TaxID=1051054 RepID=A0A3N4KDB5_9PEZI|nr:hypothetical protein P167DRAFT_494079 [Morchella conica CCBAS932]
MSSPKSTPRTHENSHDTSNLSHDEKRQVHENRMDRPPYTVDEGEHGAFKPIYKGACFCEKVTFEISRERPLEAKFCHCEGCQRLHGAPFQWAAIFHKTDVRFTSGSSELIYWHSGTKSQDYILPCKVSCKNCRTPIMDEGRKMLLLFPTLVKFGSAAEKRRFHPSCHIFYERRAIDVPDGLPKWRGHKGESEEMVETMREEHGGANI